MQPDSTPASCRRCGQCCTEGGPVLHAEDMVLVRQGVLDLSHLVCLRAGEPVLDQPGHGLGGPLRSRLETEVVKVRPRDSEAADWACRFYTAEAKGCAIYNDRPAECRAFFCQDPTGLSAMYRRGRMTRADILPPGHPLLDLAVEHDARCPAGEAVSLAEALATILGRTAPSDADRSEAHDLLARLAPLLAYDREVRALAAERDARLAPALDFLLGRPLPRVLAPLGLAVDPDTGRVRLRSGQAAQR